MLENLSEDDSYDSEAEKENHQTKNTNELGLKRLTNIPESARESTVT